MEGGNKKISWEKKYNKLQAQLKKTKESEKKWSRVAKENGKLYHKAQRAIAVRNEFMSIASHELKTPITSIKMYAQILQKIFGKSSDKRLIEYFGHIDEQVDKMSALINDLLDISRIEHKKFEMVMGKFYLDNEIKDCVQVCQATTARHTIQIEGECERKVRGDKARISQVIINLLNNAIRYSPHADKIIVKVIPLKNEVSVSIQDFGIGIDKSEVNKLFEAFYRSEAEKEKTTVGLGIGLFVSSQILKKHGSSITVDSVKGKGSTFSFSLQYA